MDFDGLTISKHHRRRRRSFDLFIISFFFILSLLPSTSFASPLDFISNSFVSLSLLTVDSGSGSLSSDSGESLCNISSEDLTPQEQHEQWITCMVVPYILAGVYFSVFIFTVVVLFFTVKQARSVSKENIYFSSSEGTIGINANTQREHQRTRRRYFAKKFFLSIIVGVMAVRGAFLATYPTITMTPSFPVTWFLIWNHGAELGLAFAYVMLLLFWLDTYLQLSSGRNVDFFFNYRVPIILFFIFLTLGFLTLSLLLFFFCEPHPGSASTSISFSCDLEIDLIMSSTLSGIFLLTALGFLVIGLYLILHVYRPKYPILISQQMRTKARTIGIAAVICTAGFSARAGIVIRALENNAAQASFNISWLQIVVFFFGTEIAPTLCMSLLLGSLTWGKSSSPTSSTSSVAPNASTRLLSASNPSSPVRVTTSRPVNAIGSHNL